jgi:hypothetical protein
MTCKKRWRLQAGFNHTHPTLVIRLHFCYSITYLETLLNTFTFISLLSEKKGEHSFLVLSFCRFRHQFILLQNQQEIELSLPPTAWSP